jgi:hypothetical protein
MNIEEFMAQQQKKRADRSWGVDADFERCNKRLEEIGGKVAAYSIVPDPLWYSPEFHWKILYGKNCVGSFGLASNEILEISRLTDAALREMLRTKFQLALETGL